MTRVMSKLPTDREVLQCIFEMYESSFPGSKGTEERGSNDPYVPIDVAQSRHVLEPSRVAPFRLYDLRHTWATRMAMAGVDLVTLAAMLGHSRIQMVLRYAHPTEEHQFAAMEKRSVSWQSKRSGERRTNNSRSRARRF